MEIIKIKDRKKWSDFLIANPGQSGLEFLASPKWSDILEREGKTVLPLAAVKEAEETKGAEEVDNFKAIFLLIKENLPGGFFYWYAPRSPIFKNDIKTEDAVKIINALVLKLQKEEPKSVFLKLEPAQNIFPSKTEIKMISASDVQPRQTLILDLNKSEDELLKAAHQKTRYNIRLAEKKEVKIIVGTAADFSEFWRLMSLTGERDGFRIHSQKHYQNLVMSGKSVSKNDDSQGESFIKMFFAEYQGQKIATALVSFFGSQVTYLHGASDNKYRNVMAPYLLQWEIIKTAKSQGAKIYDFYGIDEKKWPGVTRFKLGFSGERRIYPGVFDIPLKSGFYSLYKIFKKLKKLWR